MKTHFATAAIAAAYLAISAYGQNTCEVEANALMNQFQAQTKNQQEGTTSSEKFYVGGRDERALCTEGDQIQIGFDNRAWVKEGENVE